jgi:predicted phage terminase large subunit-like protein
MAAGVAQTGQIPVDNVPPDMEYREKRIAPQKGPQEMFIKTKADIAVYGGAAGGGKTWSILLEPLRHVQNKTFSGVVFRRTFPQIRNEGGLWDESFSLYQPLGAKPRQSEFEWVFPSGATIRFAHMQHENNKLDWQGSQVPYMAFDELTHFTESQFMYVALSRGRSMTGVKPYVRATCNPDASSWVKKFLGPWVDSTYPIKAKSGEILWMERDESGKIVWHRDLEVKEDPKLKETCVSVTFVRASIFDNQIMLQENPSYLARLRSLPPVEKERLLNGDWDVVPTAGKVFNRNWAQMLEDIPERPKVEIIRSYGTKQEREWIPDPDAPYSLVRFWDLAATEKELESDNPDFTVGLKMLRYGNKYVTIDVIRGQFPAGEIEDIIIDAAYSDGFSCAVRWEIEGGSAGKILTASLQNRLGHFDAMGVRPQGSKLARFRPFAQAAHNGQFEVLRREWSEPYLGELHHFPDKGWKKDQVDGTSGAFTYLSVFGTDVIEGPILFTDEVQEPMYTPADLDTVAAAGSRRLREKRAQQLLGEWLS